MSVLDDSKPGSPSSDLAGLVAEPNLSGRAHTLTFSSSEVSGALHCSPYIKFCVFVVSGLMNKITVIVRGGASLHNDFYIKIAYDCCM